MKLNIVLVSVVLTVTVLAAMSCTAKKNVVSEENFIEKFSWSDSLPEDSNQRVDDAAISSAVNLKFSQDELISGSRINVDTTNGTVTLNGKVSSQKKIDRALHLVRSVKGVKSVESNLVVN